MMPRTLPTASSEPHEQHARFDCPSARRDQCDADVPFRAILLTTVAMLCFAANSILCRLALGPRLIDAATFTTVRVLSAATMLIAVTWLQRHQLPRLTQVKPLSAAALFTYLIFFSFAYVRLDAGSGALILIGAVQLTMFSVASLRGGAI